MFWPWLKPQETTVAVNDIQAMFCLKMESIDELPRVEKLQPILLDPRMPVWGTIVPPQCGFNPMIPLAQKFIMENCP